jgi:hypothetical protein
MKPGRRRQAVDDLRGAWRVSIRRACAVLMVERSSYHYRGRRPDRAALRTRIKEIAETRVRYGYRRVHALLQREGCTVMSNWSIGCIAKWACNCGLKRRDARSKPNCGRAARHRRHAMTSGRWASCMTNSSMAARHAR